MIFLGPLYRLVATNFATKINHFPLVKLVFVSLDKTILYLLLFMLVRWAIKKMRHQRLHVGQELRVGLVAAYVILLLMLTVFRNAYYPWQLVWHWHRHIAAVNIVPLVETFKLWFARTRFDFWYQSVGNAAAFLPLGFGFSWISRKKRTLWQTFLVGVGLSLVIEALQFFLISGVSDIDDVIFNTLGALAGWWFYRLFHHHK